MKRRKNVIDSDSDEGEGNGLDDIVQAHERANLSGSENEEENVDEGRVEGSDEENQDVPEAEAKPEGTVDPVKIAKRKTGIKRIIMNTERLKSRKGVHTIEKLFEGFKFHGKGYEMQDLDRVMKRMEYWAYRVFPKLDFPDFLGKVEQLGSKKDLQAHLKKYRLGMIDADFDNQLPDDVDEDVVEETGENPEGVSRQNELLAQIQNERFEALFDDNDFNN